MNFKLISLTNVRSERREHWYYNRTHTMGCELDSWGFWLYFFSIVLWRYTQDECTTPIRGWKAHAPHSFQDLLEGLVMVPLQAFYKRLHGPKVHGVTYIDCSPRVSPVTHVAHRPNREPILRYVRTVLRICAPAERYLAAIRVRQGYGHARWIVYWRHRQGTPWMPDI